MNHPSPLDMINPLSLLEEVSKDNPSIAQKIFDFESVILNQLQPCVKPFGKMGKVWICECGFTDNERTNPDNSPYTIDYHPDLNC